MRIPFFHISTPRNYLSKLINYESLLDASNSLSQLDEFVSVSWQLLEKAAPVGIYNLTNPGFVTTRQVVAMIQKAGLSKKQFKFFASEAEFMRTAAMTPRSNCILNTDKIVATGIKVRPVEEALEWSIKNWKNENAK